MARATGGQIHTEKGRMIPVSEAEQREVFLRAIENDHPLMDLIQRCINNDPQLRPHASEIIRRVSWIASVSCLLSQPTGNAETN